MKNLFLLSVFSLLSIFNLKAQDHDKSYYNLEDGIAIQGYDPVAYFTVKKAVKGSKKFQAKNDGVTYYFASEANKKMFADNPKKYTPKYGGWCAYAIGDSGEKVKIDPETFKIIDGELYLFYNFFPVNTLNKWNKDEVKLKNKADSNWKNENK